MIILCAKENVRWHSQATTVNGEVTLSSIGPLARQKIFRNFSLELELLN